MKHNNLRFRIMIAALCLVMMLGMLTVSSYAAKDRMKYIENVEISGIDVPAEGQYPDTSAVETDARYEVVSVNWYMNHYTNRQNPISSSRAFESGAEYTVEIRIKTSSSSYMFNTKNGGTTVTATVNGNPAYVCAVYGMDTEKYLDILYTFPKTITLVNSVNITELVEPYADDEPYFYGVPDNKNAFVASVDWYDGSREMGVHEKFVEGKTYTVHFILVPKYGCEFAVDTNHIFASPGYPFTAVKATINGKTATVLPDNEKGTAANRIIVAAKFVCKASRQITEVAIIDVTEPKTGEEPKYYIECADSTYQRYSISNVFYAYGVGWLDGNDNLMRRNESVFEPSTAYTIEITLEAVEPYIFKTTEYGYPMVTATVNGKSAEVHKSTMGDDMITITYKFRKTDSTEVDKVSVTDLEEPKSGSYPDYDVTLGDTTYVLDTSSYIEHAQNGVQWYNDTTYEIMVPGVDKFKGGNTYSAIIFLNTKQGFTFEYDAENDEYKINAKINGKTATVEEVYDTYATIWYSFTLPEDVHVCTLKKVAEVKATCATEGKEAYYHCDECGKNYEDAKGSKEISSIDTWGVNATVDHKGGKATCADLAVCEVCGKSYGDLAEHKYGKKAVYVDESGHARICTVCGTNEKVAAHTGGSADCKNKAECEVCGKEYGKLGDHVWSESWEYTSKDGHAKECTVKGCKEQSEITPHTPGPEPTSEKSQDCTVCGYVIKPASEHKHDIVKVKEVKPTCDTEGKKEHYVCNGCGGIFADSKGKEPIDDKNSLVIAANGHTESKWKYDKNEHWKVCTVRDCKIVITDVKGEHDFDENNTCTVCGYTRGGKADTDTEEISEEITEEESTEEESTEETTAEEKTDNNVSTDDTGNDTGDNTGDSGKTLMIVSISAIAVALIFIVVLVVVIAKKKK
ncbi:MAG: hypothetical protein IKL81_04600 [Clostridia bacterium]|nr:hypothetical protein [Clostridia bacterium]